MKLFLPLASVAVLVVLSACATTTLENRRDMYSPQVVNGPYTRMLHEGVHYTQTTTVTTKTTTQSDYKNVVQ